MLKSESDLDGVSLTPVAEALRVQLAYQHNDIPQEALVKKAKQVVTFV